MGGMISRRWEMAWLLLSGLLILYTLRVNMSVAAQKMKIDLNWTELEKGYILSSFYWGYVIGQIPASCIAQYYGAKWLFGLSVLIPAFLTIMVPMACNHSFAAALTIRVLIGFFESASFPAIYHFFPIWVPTSEKTFMIPFIISGIYLGEIVGFSFSGILAESEIYINGQFYGGWPSIFYVFGLAGVLWFPLWIYAAHESPAVHPYISEEELQYMRSATNLGITTAKALEKAILEDSDIEAINFDHLPAPHRGSNRLQYIRNTIIGSIHISSNQYNKIQTNEQLTGNIESVELSPIHSSQGNNMKNTNKTHHNRGYSSISSNENSMGVMNPTQSSSSKSNNSCSTGNSLSTSPLTPQHPAPTANTTTATATSPAATPPTTTSTSTPPTTSYAHSLTSDTPHQPLPQLTRAQEEELMVAARIELATHTPWSQFLSHPVALCLLAANFQYGWMNFTLLSEMPSFFTDVLGFDLRSAGVLCIFPYLALYIAAIVSGLSFEYLEQKQGWSTSKVRFSAQFIAYFCSGVVLIMCGFTHSTMGAYGFMILTLVFFGANQSGLGCVWTDIAPNYSSSLNSLGNTIGAVAGILGPIFVSACTTAWPKRGEGWQVAFFVTFAMSCVTLLLWYIYVKAEIVPVLNSPRPA